MLATPGTRADVVGSGQEWVVEMTWDGIRAIVSVADGAVRVTSRSGRDVTAAFPELAVLAERVPDRTVLDGEIVTLDAHGRPDFELLQRRTNPGWRGGRGVPVRLLLFDLLAAQGRSWLAVPDDDGELRYAGWTADGRLRHARWRGWREDKSPREVRREG